MTNNIQHYRKQLGLSQDELAQKLFVSRQTVSQWETGQTMPTTDNLMRLREILGVSIDELLDGSAHNNGCDSPVAIEHYTFYFTQTQIAALYKQHQNNAVFPLLKPAVLTAVLALWMAFNQSWIAVAAMVGILFVLALLIILRMRFIQKSKKEAIARVPASTYEYETFDDCFFVKIYRNNEVTVSAKHYYCDIKKISIFGSLLTVSAGTQLYLLNRDSLLPNSVFLHLYAQQNAKSEANPRHKTISFCLVGASILSLFLAIAVISKSASGSFSSLLLFWAFLPIPVASVVVGIILKKKGYPKYRKNIIVGIIFVILLAGYGTLGYMPLKAGVDNPAAFNYLEELSQTDFPEPERIINMPYDESNTQITGLDTDRMKPICTTYVHFGQSNNEIEAIIKNNSHWQHPLDKELPDLLMPMQNSNALYLCFYNKEENTFNTIPGKPGTYHIYAAIFDPENGLLKIDEYYLNYP